MRLNTKWRQFIFDTKEYHHPLPLSCRAPLIWIVIPLVSGFLLADSGIIVKIKSRELIIAGFTLSILALFSLNVQKRVRNTVVHGTWAFCFIFGLLLLSAAYFQIRTPIKNTIRSTLPPREANVSIKITRIFEYQDQFGNSSGLAEIVDCPQHLKDLLGNSVLFDIRPDNIGRPMSKGVILRITGILSILNDDQHLTGFEEYLDRRGIHFKLENARMTQFVEQAPWFQSTCTRLYFRFQDYLELGAPDGSKLSSIYEAMMLGKKNALSQEQKMLFLKTGTMHLFAISGLHIGIIAYTLNCFLKLSRLRIPERVILGLILLFFYVQITGAKPSAMRAFIMVFIYWGSLGLKKKQTPFSALLLSAIIVLILDPNQLWNPGFQLSYAVVFAILLYGLPLSEHIIQSSRPEPALPAVRIENFILKMVLNFRKNLKILLAVSIAATLAGTPLTILYFNTFTPGSILLSLFLLPLAGLLITSGIIAIGSGLLGIPWIAAYFNHGVWILLTLMDTVVSLFCHIPGLFLALRFKQDLWGYLLIVLILAMLFILHKRYLLARPLFFTIPHIFLLIYLLAFTHPT